MTDMNTNLEFVISSQQDYKNNAADQLENIGHQHHQYLHERSTSCTPVLFQREENEDKNNNENLNMDTEELEGQTYDLDLTKQFQIESRIMDQFGETCTIEHGELDESGSEMEREDSG